MLESKGVYKTRSTTASEKAKTDFSSLSPLFALALAPLLKASLPLTVLVAPSYSLNLEQEQLKNRNKIRDK